MLGWDWLAGLYLLVLVKLGRAGLVLLAGWVLLLLSDWLLGIGWAGWVL